MVWEKNWEEWDFDFEVWGNFKTTVENKLTMIENKLETLKKGPHPFIPSPKERGKNVTIGV